MTALAPNEYFRAVAIDYDGTLAEADEPSPEVLEALEELRELGRKAILVTGRILEELRHVFPHVDRRFDAIVAENGAVLSVEGTTRLLSPPVEFELDEALVGQAVPFRRGQVILATQEAHEAEVSREIRRLGLECQLARNRGELMLLPPGINKGFGVYQALGDLGISHHNAIGVGDAENDHSLLRTCEIGVAVADAVEGLKRHADVVLEKPGGAALAAFLRSAVASGEAGVPTRRWRLELGRDREGARVDLPGSRVNVLITGRSKSGKSFLAGLLAEQMIGLGYSVCIIDPEGDYASLGALRGVLNLGGEEGLPPPERIGRLIEHRFGSVLVDLSMLERDARAAYAAQLLDRLEEERRVTGLPHWIICDEAHDHLGGPDRVPGAGPSHMKGYCVVTYRPDAFGGASREAIDFVLALPGGKRIEGVPDPIATLERVFELDLEAVEGWDDAGSRAVLLASPQPPEDVRFFEMNVRRRPHVRHWHKYVRGRLPSALRFHFRNESGETRITAANMRELRRGLLLSDAAVLRHHAPRGDFSRWLSEAIQDTAMARTVEALEGAFRMSERAEGDVERLREELVAEVEERYAD